MDFDALTSARMQFAFTVSFHIIFPVFSIGLASYLALLNGLSLVTGRAVFASLFDYWEKIFAVAGSRQKPAASLTRCMAC